MAARRLTLVYDDGLAHHQRRDGLDKDRRRVNARRRRARTLGTAHHLPGEHLEALEPGLGHAIDCGRARTIVGFGQWVVLDVAGHGRELSLDEGAMNVAPV